MREAIGLAKRGECATAYRYTLITQCDDPDGQAEVEAAGALAVCNYLRSR